MEEETLPVVGTRHRNKHTDQMATVRKAGDYNPFGRGDDTQLGVWLDFDDADETTRKISEHPFDLTTFNACWELV